MFPILMSLRIYLQSYYLFVRFPHAIVVLLHHLNAKHSLNVFSGIVEELKNSVSQFSFTVFSLNFFFKSGPEQQFFCLLVHILIQGMQSVMICQSTGLTVSNLFVLKLITNQSKQDRTLIRHMLGLTTLSLIGILETYQSMKE